MQLRLCLAFAVIGFSDGRLSTNTYIATDFLSERTPLEHCCVHNMSPFISSSGLSPGSREAEIQRAKVCLNCTEQSVARSSYWLLPVGRYLSDSRCKGSVVIFMRWSASNMAEEPQCLLVTRWESGEQPVVLLTLTHGEYTVSSRSCIVPTCQMHQDESAGTLWWPKSHTHTSTLAQCMSDRGVTWFPAWCLTSRYSSPAKLSYANPMQDFPSAATRGVNHASQIDKCIDHFNMSIIAADNGLKSNNCTHTQSFNILWCWIDVVVL